MARSKTVSIDDAVLRSKIRKMAKRLKIEEETLVVQQGALLSVDLAKYTPPYDKFPSGNISKMPVATDADIDRGERAIMQDCHNVFRAKPYGFILFCYREFGNGFTNQKMTSKNGTEYTIEYRAIGRSVHEMFKFHEQMVRPSNGRTGYKQDIQSMWVDESLFKEYVEWRTRNIGLAKASLLRAAKAVNPKVRFKVASKVRKMIKKANGRGSIKKTNKGPVAKMQSSSPGLQHTARHTNRAMKGRLTAMATRLEFLTRKAGKKSGFKVR